MRVGRHVCQALALIMTRACNLGLRHCPQVNQHSFDGVFSCCPAAGPAWMRQCVIDVWRVHWKGCRCLFLGAFLASFEDSCTLAGMLDKKMWFCSRSCAQPSGLDSQESTPQSPASVLRSTRLGVQTGANEYVCFGCTAWGQTAFSEMAAQKRTPNSTRTEGGQEPVYTSAGPSCARMLLWRVSS